jgi:hypothetical protein
MSGIRYLLPAVPLLLAAPGPVFPQDNVEDAVTELTATAAKRYISPMVSGFGANMNAGWYHKAPPADKIGFSVEGGWLIMATFLDKGGKTFDVQGDFRFSQDQAGQMLAFMDTEEPYASLPSAQRQALKDSLALRLASEDFRVGFGGPTITGSSKDSVRVRFEGKTFNVSGYPDSIVVPADTVALPVTGILDGLPLIPLMAPQFTLGTVYGTNVTFRYLPTVEFTPEVGAFKFFGFGVQHNPQVWLGSPLPVDL